jgi:hypothetical protein
MKVGAEGTDLWLDLENVKKGRLHVVIHRADITSPEMLQIVQRLSEVERPVDETELAAAGVTRPQLLGYEPFVCPPENDWEVVNGEGKGREGKEEDDDEPRVMKTNSMLVPDRRVSISRDDERSVWGKRGTSWGAGGQGDMYGRVGGGGARTSVAQVPALSHLHGSIAGGTLRMQSARALDRVGKILHTQTDAIGAWAMATGSSVKDRETPVPSKYLWISNMGESMADSEVKALYKIYYSV